MYASGVEQQTPQDRALAEHARPQSGPFASLWRHIPNSGVQFVDVILPTRSLAQTIGRFVEDHQGDDGAVLVPITDKPDFDGSELHPVTRRVLQPTQSLWLTGYQGLEPFLDRWVPLPFLRFLKRDSTQNLQFDTGPGNWARILIASPTGMTLRDAQSLHAVIAFDTGLAEHSRLDQADYLAPNVDDAALGSVFALAVEPSAVATFLAETWVDNWLAGLAAERRSAEAKPATDDRSNPPSRFSLEHVAQYLVLLRVLADSGLIQAAHFADAGGSSEHARSIGVDLMLDIGDDQTSALLLEQRSAHEPRMALAGAQMLNLRDLTQPTVVHTGPYPTVVEFERPNFGDAAGSRRSGRLDAFNWPSLSRVGHEGLRLSLRSSAAPGITGLSELGRSLQTTGQRARPWRFARGDSDTLDAGAAVSGELLSHLTEDGTVIGTETSSMAPAIRARFSESSLLSLFVAETVLHALAQINNPARQTTTGAVRRLDRVIVSCSSAASAEDRNLLLDRIEGGIKLVWCGYGWENSERPGQARRPQASLGLDASLSAQLLYLFDEVSNRLGGNARLFVDLARDRSRGASAGRRLSVASIDVAMGSSTLSAVDYEVDAAGSIRPDLLMTDRSAIGGRVLRDAVAASIVLPAIVSALHAAGHPDADGLLASLVNNTSAEVVGGDRYFGERVLHKIIQPAAAALFDHYQALPASAHAGLRDFSLAGLVDRGGGRLEPLADRIEAIARAHGAREFRLGAVRISLRPKALSRVIEAALAPLIDEIGAMILDHDVDVLVLSGAYAGLSDLKRMLHRKLPIAPHRIVDLSERELSLIERLNAPVAAGASNRLLAVAGASIAARMDLENAGFNLVAGRLQQIASSAHRAGEPDQAIEQADGGRTKARPRIEGSASSDPDLPTAVKPVVLSVVQRT